MLVRVGLEVRREAKDERPCSYSPNDRVEKALIEFFTQILAGFISGAMQLKRRMCRVDVTERRGILPADGQKTILH